MNFLFGRRFSIVDIGAVAFVSSVDYYWLYEFGVLLAVFVLTEAIGSRYGRR